MGVEFGKACSMATCDIFILGVNEMLQSLWLAIHIKINLFTNNAMSRYAAKCMRQIKSDVQFNETGEPYNFAIF